MSSVPVGAGLSSSAALEVATYTLLEALSGCRTIKLNDKVKVELNCRFSSLVGSELRPVNYNLKFPE